MDTLSGLVYFDADVIIYLLEGFEKYRDTLREILGSLEKGLFKGLTSELTLAETLVKPYQEKNEKLAKAYQSFLAGRESLQVVPIDRQILLRAALYRSKKGIKLPDAIHLATASNYGCRYFFTNDGRLRSVEGLSVVQLSELHRQGDPPGIHEPRVAYRAGPSARLRAGRGKRGRAGKADLSLDLSSGAFAKEEAHRAKRETRK